jgi:hypothetical protein
MIKAMECFGEIMNDGHINIPEGEKRLLNWKAGRKIRLILLTEEAGEDLLKNLQEKGLIKAPAKERIKPLNKRRLIHVKGEPMSETVIKLRGER